LFIELHSNVRGQGDSRRQVVVFLLAFRQMKKGDGKKVVREDDALIVVFSLGPFDRFSTFDFIAIVTFPLVGGRASDWPFLPFTSLLQIY